jgi:hypothetical protein
MEEEFLPASGIFRSFVSYSIFSTRSYRRLYKESLKMLYHMLIMAPDVHNEFDQLCLFIRTFAFGSPSLLLEDPGVLGEQTRALRRMQLTI